MLPLIKPFNAIPSWEDYEYQGHIALYFSLKKILELIQNGESISAYELQLEGEEDFSIRKDSKYISLHQVKAGAINLNENDKFAFIIGILQNDAEKGFFHITENRKIPVDFINSTLKHISILKNELSKEVKEEKDVNKKDRGNYIIFNEISGNHKKADVYDIIKFVADNPKDIQSVCLAIDNINNTLDEIIENINKKVNEFKKTNTTAKIDEVFVEEYEEHFDNIKQIRESAYEVIINILDIKCKKYTFVDHDYAAFVYDQVLLYMKTRITEFYITKIKNGKCILTFDEILEGIVTDYHEKLDSEDYQYYQVLRSIRDTFAEYPGKRWTNCQNINCTECNESKRCHLFEQIKLLDGKTVDEQNNIIHNLLLFTPVKGKSNNLPQDSLVSHLFLNLLDEIKTLVLKNSSVYEVIKDKSVTYRLTLDSSYDVYDFQEKLEKEIKKESNKSLLFECDVLITDRLQKENLIFNGGNINKLTEKEMDEIKGITSATIDKMKKDSNKPKVIRVIDKDTALGELK